MTKNGNWAKVVLIIDPQRLRQAGLVRLLEDWAEANGLGVTAISPPEELNVGPNCAMVVLSVGGASVLDQGPQLWIRSIRTIMREVPLVILSDREDRREIRAAFREGAKGFIATNLDPSLALEALTFLHHGGSFFPSSVLLDEPRSEHGEAIENGSAVPEVARSMHTAFRTSVRVAATQASHPPQREVVVGDQADLSLTPRQREVLARLGEGKANKVIARDLNMTEATVKVHVRQIMRKFGAANRTQAALRAMRFAAALSGQRSAGRVITTGPLTEPPEPA